jgi:hypothetical protein
MLTHRVVLNHDNTLTSYGSSNYWNNSKTEIWASSPSNTVQISFYLITIFSDHSEMCLVDANLHTMRDQGNSAYMASCSTKNILCRWHQELHGAK